MFRKVVLNNGVRVVAERMPATRSVTLGIWVNVGSRDEQPGEEGVSHFIEHMVFKGTRRRSAAQISREIDSLGGEMNAFTTRETTAFYVKVVDEHLRPACALLADLFYGSRFEPKEVEKEKLVVLEEIRMIQDDPEDLLHDLHIKHQLQRHPLGKPIVGEPATIKRFKRDFLLGYVARHYVPQQTVLAVAGAFEWKSLVPVLEASFGSVERKANGQRVQRWPAAVGSGLLVQRRSLEQVHLCFGLKGVSIDHKDRYAAHVLNAALGGGVSSRLFQRIREERGLAYSIYSYLSGYSDTGMLAIYAGTSPRQAPRVVELACRELRRVRRTGLDRKELERAKNQLKGGLMLSLESTHSRMHKLAKEELYHGRHSTLQELLADIDRVSAAQVARLAQDLLDPRSLSLTVLGPVSRRTIQGALN